MVTTNEIWQLLEQVADPEIPVLTIVDLGIVRTVEILDSTCIVTITPTYSGCPAMHMIEEEIKKALTPVIQTEVKSTLSPAWTTDWMSENGKIKLREYGIAPPENEVDKSVLFAKPTIVPCPKCNSDNTRMVSQFGSTACKAHYQCNVCQEPFDYFKCLR
ncbi:MAG: phenylacetate-CoA oxygenase subunit PaaJ [Crocinitomicaceae bacterium]|jgi:ring-1,2-phenylacetyl-CoA epoxidase subunit PaaD|nr:phenylacetate-CoA oxygenase subunit PaaJ [Crocinitomicaceae bacterium]